MGFHSIEPSVTIPTPRGTPLIDTRQGLGNMPKKVREKVRKYLEKIRLKLPHKLGKFDFYILPLFARWSLLSENQQNIQRKLLYSDLGKDFSEAVGGNVAVYWLMDDELEEPDFERMEKYFEKFKIKEPFKKAPHIVILTKHPDKWTESDPIARISLNLLSPESLHAYLARIAQEVRKKRLPKESKERMLIIFEHAKKVMKDSIEKFDVEISLQIPL
jgi:hypothetical protein